VGILHQGTMLKNCILILPVSDPAKQAAQVVKHHVFEQKPMQSVPITTDVVSSNLDQGEVYPPPPPPPPKKNQYEKLLI
jgi:hypothetical protein